MNTKNTDGTGSRRLDPVWQRVIVGERQFPEAAYGDKEGPNNNAPYHESRYRAEQLEYITEYRSQHPNDDQDSQLFYAQKNWVQPCEDILHSEEMINKSAGRPCSWQSMLYIMYSIELSSGQPRGSKQTSTTAPNYPSSLNSLGSLALLIAVHLLYGAGEHSKSRDAFFEATGESVEEGQNPFANIAGFVYNPRIAVVAPEKTKVTTKKFKVTDGNRVTSQSRVTKGMCS